MDKILELVLYIADQSVDDPGFGMVKLNKILFNADFTYWGQHRRSISGADYQHEKNGPVVRQMKPLLTEHEMKDFIIKVVKKGPYAQKRLITLRLADLSGFTAEEISYVDQSINILRGYSATQVSDVSHDFPGWKLTRDGEPIPYETMLISEAPLSEEEAQVRVELVEAV